MNNYKDRITYLAHSYIGIANRYKNWQIVKELIERNKNTEADVKKRIKELYARN